MKTNGKDLNAKSAKIAKENGYWGAGTCVYQFIAPSGSFGGPSGHLQLGGRLANLGSVRAFLQRWLVTAAGVMMASSIVRGIDYGSFGSLLVASLLLGIFNAVLRPIMLILSLPLLLLTLGLFTFVVNALLLLLVGSIVKSFYVGGFWPALWGGIVISIVSFVANGLIGKPVKRPVASEPPPSQRKPPPGKGPIIDV